MTVFSLHKPLYHKPSFIRRSLLAFLILCCSSLILLSCDKADNLYYRGTKAKFSYSFTNTIPELNAALNGYGEFCTIRTNGDTFIFANLKSSTTRPYTKAEQQIKPMLGLSGFIVGRTNMPDIGAEEPAIVAFDLACPCYDEYATTRNLLLQDGGLAICNRCGRTYDLNNVMGVVVKGPTGRGLYRYPVSYNAMGNTLKVMN